MAFLDFPITQLPEAAERLRLEVRDFLHSKLEGYPAEKRAHSWSGFDRDFSRALGEQGWIGMTWPKAYGGHERSMLERYVVVEEVLAAGAPVGAHWVADRQSGPLLLRFGTEGQKRRYLPRMARGDLCLCIGMSEPNSGSDLASIRTKATREDRGWRLSGTKLWTTNAHRADAMILLARTTGGTTRHSGLSQFIFDIDTKGVSIKSIPDLTGEPLFNEVVLDDVLLPPDALIGEEGDGWKQVTTELSFERSGPERYLSSIQLVLELIRAVGSLSSGPLRQWLGRVTAEAWTLRQMSLSVAGVLAAGGNPSLVAAVVKDLGTAFEQEIPKAVQALMDDKMLCDETLQKVLAYVLQASPSFSLRGGTREILRGIIARNLGLR